MVLFSWRKGRDAGVQIPWMANGASKARWSKNTEELTRQDMSELVPRIHATIKRPNVQRTLAGLGHGVAIAVVGPVIVRCVMSIQPMMGRTERKGKKYFLHN